MYKLPHLYAEVSAIVYIARLLCCVRDGLRRLCPLRHHQGPLLLVKLIPAQGKSWGAMGAGCASPQAVGSVNEGGLGERGITAQPPWRTNVRNLCQHALVEVAPLQEVVEAVLPTQGCLLPFCS